MLVLLAGCASVPPADYGSTRAGFTASRRMELSATPFHPQLDAQCGPAALATVLGSAGVERSAQQLADEVYLPQRHGSLQPEMLAAARRAELLAYPLAPRPDDLLSEVAAGHPVLVLQNLRFDWLPQWHYAVVVGYDLDAGTIVLRSGGEKRLTMSLARFDRSWAGAGRWAFVALPAGQLPATAQEETYLAAAAALETRSPAAARRAYRAALDAWPASLLARLGSGNAAYRLHHLDEAEADYRQATLEHPAAADAWNNLAQVLFERGRQPAALVAARRAVELGGPRLPLYQATLAAIAAGAVP
jgi:tetratricopeptide (TPR) repeat protein